jgi:hypothetical protein
VFLFQNSQRRGRHGHQAAKNAAFKCAKEIVENAAFTIAVMA